MSLCVRLGAGDSLFNPSVDAKIFTEAKIVDFKPLVFHCLLITADTNISVNHIKLVLVFGLSRCLFRGERVKKMRKIVHLSNFADKKPEI